jgi:hypothetical protein
MKTKNNRMCIEMKHIVPITEPRPEYCRTIDVSRGSGTTGYQGQDCFLTMGFRNEVMRTARRTLIM